MYKKRSRRGKQNVYKMIGCSRKHRHTKNCSTKKQNKSIKNICRICGKKCKHHLYGGSNPIAPLSWSKMNKFGGNSMAVPGPFVGQPWTSNPDTWPGVDGISGNRNYLENYKDVIQNDPTRQISMNASGLDQYGGYIYEKSLSSSGSKTRKNKGQIIGGGIIPQDLVNLGRDIGFNFKSAYNALNGYKQPVDPSPYKDQLRSNNVAVMV